MMIMGVNERVREVGGVEEADRLGGFIQTLPFYEGESCRPCKICWGGGEKQSANRFIIDSLTFPLALFRSNDLMACIKGPIIILASKLMREEENGALLLLFSQWFPKGGGKRRKDATWW